MSRFNGDARDFRKPGESLVLVLTADLLDELGGAGCHRDEQERAVEQRLADNEPNEVLALSLREDGFLHLPSGAYPGAYEVIKHPSGWTAWTTPPT